MRRRDRDATVANDTQQPSPGGSPEEPKVDGYVILNATLLPEVAATLAALSAQSGLSKTDIVNRAHCHFPRSPICLYPNLLIDQDNALPHYIEFASNSSDPGLLGSPTYFGVPDPRIELDGIRVDGEEITLADPSLVDTLHRALVDGPKLIRRGDRGFDCVAFALLMCGVDLVQAVKTKEFHVVSDTDDGEGVTDDTRQAYPLAIGEWPRWRNQPHYFHTIIPAHTTEGPLYLHKLADAGPICLSGIRRAQRIVEGDQLARVTSMTVNVGRRTVAEWRHDAGRR